MESQCEGGGELVAWDKDGARHQAPTAASLAFHTSLDFTALVQHPSVWLSPVFLSCADFRFPASPIVFISSV